MSDGTVSAYVTVRYLLADVCLPEDLDESMTLDRMVRDMIDWEGGPDVMGGLAASAVIVSVERTDEP